MALKAVEALVKNRLPFLADTQETTDLINDFKTEVYYFLSNFTKYEDPDIEDDSKYDGTLRLLVVELVSLEIINRKILLNMEGSKGSAGTGARRLKKGKADVVEGEFHYFKAEDGSALLMQAEKLLPEIKMKACQYAGLLKYRLPMCLKKTYTVPPFKAYVKDIYGNLT